MSGTAPQLAAKSRDFGPAPQAGDIVADRYRIDEMVGEGGMGVVAKATHLELGSHVAIKFLNPEALERRDGLQRFAQEARTIANLKSPHVVKVFDVNSRATRPYMVMELLNGEDLDSGIVRGELPPIHDVIRYFRQACDALIEAHTAGVIHRDLKPANLFLTKLPNGNRILKILDFGIAKVFQVEDPVTPGAAKLTGMREVFGSPAYMSPEQIASASSVDARSDVWSLGVAFYEVLTCKQPFVGEFPDIFLSIATREPVPLATYRGDVPPALEEIILKCLRKSRADRFQSMSEVDEALAILEAELGIPEAPGSLREVLRPRAASVPDAAMRPRAASVPESGVMPLATAVMPMTPRVPTAVMPMEVAPAPTPSPAPAPTSAPASSPALETRRADTSGARNAVTVVIPDEPAELPVKSRTPLVLVAAAALLLVGGGIFGVTRFGGPAPTPAAPAPSVTTPALPTVPVEATQTATAQTAQTPQTAPPSSEATATAAPTKPKTSGTAAATPTAKAPPGTTAAPTATAPPVTTSTAGPKNNDPFGGGRK